jgi:hypothetical protein
MAKMTKAQARKRLKEALTKLQLVYIKGHEIPPNYGMSTQDMDKLEKIILKNIKRFN